MKRRNFLIGSAAAAALALAGGQAMASGYAEDVIAQLTKQGYGAIEVETTWLGRVHITARRDGGMRDIVLNPRTGEILRDTFTDASGAAAPKVIIDDVDDNSGSGTDDTGGDDNSGSGSGSGGGDDNSGSGGSGGDDNSGSGSDNSGHGGGDDDKGDDDKGGKVN